MVFLLRGLRKEAFPKSSPITHPMQSLRPDALEVIEYDSDMAVTLSEYGMWSPLLGWGPTSLLELKRRGVGSCESGFVSEVLTSHLRTPPPADPVAGTM